MTTSHHWPVEPELFNLKDRFERPLTEQTKKRGLVASMTADTCWHICNVRGKNTINC